MRSKAGLIACSCVCLTLAACPSGPSSSAPDKTSAVERKAEFLQELVNRRGLAAKVWSELAAAAPDRLWPTEVVWKDGEVKITGSALSYDLLADFISRLEESSHLTDVDLRSSAQKKGRAGDHYEFTVAARSAGDGEAPPSRGSAPSQARLVELELALSVCPQTADGLRELQRLASDSGLRMTKCTFGQALMGEFAGEQPALIEIEGSRSELGRYLSGMVELPHFRYVKELLVKSVDPRDARSPVKASITALAYFPN
jgi:hypothetical protein